MPSPPGPSMIAATPEVLPRCRVEIDAERCKGCDLCVVVCPHRNLRLTTGFNRSGYHPVEFHFHASRGDCTACGLCYWVCPDFAITEVARRRP
jgi:2-oxoglutarate ferredoxin oxidoreductase subunit delta